MYDFTSGEGLPWRLNMLIALEKEDVFQLWEHLHTRKYYVMHLRRKYKDRTLIGGFTVADNKIKGMFSCDQDYFEIEISLQADKPIIEVIDSFENVKYANMIEQRLAKYVSSRIAQERQMDLQKDKFTPKYKKGEIYLRRRKSSVMSHEINKKHSANSRLVANAFAERLAGMNLVLRFKPKL